MIGRKDDKEVFIDLLQWSEAVKAVGTPSMAIMPARNYNFKVLEGQFSISIPRKGRYSDIDPEFFSDKDGEFNIFDENKGILYLPSITKVLFATHRYPDLASNQLFVPVGLVFKEEEVVILAQILEMKVNPDEE